MRDRAAAHLASGSASKRRGRGQRLVWVAIGIGIGAVLAGGRLSRMLPTDLAGRLDDLVTPVRSLVNELRTRLSSDDHQIIDGPAARTTEPTETVTLDVDDPQPVG